MFLASTTANLVGVNATQSLAPGVAARITLLLDDDHLPITSLVETCQADSKPPSARQLLPTGETTHFVMNAQPHAPGMCLEFGEEAQTLLTVDGDQLSIKSRKVRMFVGPACPLTSLDSPQR